jgi:nucleotide-binding universal stress UspA family protein
MTNAAVVVPLDGSKNSELAVPVAALFARLYESPVTFVHVAPAKAHATEEERNRAQQVFEEYVLGLADTRGIAREQCTVELLHGNAAEEVLDLAEGARFIVLATHGRGGFRAALVGSVADKVVRGATSPVVLVPVHAETHRREGQPILVAVDGSKAAEEGLAFARDLGQRAGQPISLIRAYDMLPAMPAELMYYPADLVGVNESTAKDYLAATAHSDEDTLLAQGRPDVVIAKAAKEIDAALVVMATRGMGLARRITLGSTTDRLMREIDRPLLIVPGHTAE